jgi:uncharacterized protein YjbJ (UPF0337 family)
MTKIVDNHLQAPWNRKIYTGGWTMGLKEAYQEKMRGELELWQAKIEVLKAKADVAGADQKIKYYEQIESLRVKQQQVHKKLDDLRSASEGAWDEVKAGVEFAWEDLKSAVERAADKFK